MGESKYRTEKCVSILNKKAIPLVEFSHNDSKSHKSKIRYELYKGGTILQKYKRILVASTKRLQYSGANYEREAFNVTSSVLKIAVRNKRTNKLKFYNVDYFLLKPILKCTISVDDREKSFVEKSQELALEFGSKNKKKSLTSKQKFQFADDETVDESILKKMSENMQTITEVTASEKPPTDSIIPPQNKNAENVAEIYNIFDIISQEEYAALESEMIIFKDLSSDTVESWRSESKYSALVLNYLELHFQFLSDENAKLICYLNYMTQFANLKYNDLKRKDPAPSIPQPFKKNMMERYLVNKTLPQRKKDKLLADMIVLYLHLNCFFIDANLIASSTKIPLKRLTSIAYALGCHVHSSKNDISKKIELKLPLYVYVPFGRKKQGS